MICESCNQAESRVHCTFIVRGKPKQEAHLCESCAKQNGVPLESVPLSADAYVPLALRTEAPVQSALQRLQDPPVVRLLHAGMGLATESGEFLDALKKAIFYGKQLDGVNLQEEIGDLCWYLAVAIDALAYMLPPGQHKAWADILQQNVDKLRARFPERFTEEHAQVRDLDTERKALAQGAGVMILLRRIEREFGSPFLPAGFVRLRRVEDDTFMLSIGDRDLEVDCRDGSLVGSNSAVGEQRRWEITPRP